MVGKVGKTVQKEYIFTFGGSDDTHYTITPVTIQKDCNTQVEVVLEDYHASKIDALEELVVKLTDGVNGVLRIED